MRPVLSSRRPSYCLCEKGRLFGSLSLCPWTRLPGPKAASLTTRTARSSHSSSSASSGGDKRAGRLARGLLLDRPARTRFAPSPTGYLHLGSLRTALFNYLLARATNGQFLLRLEDTDQSRIVGDAEDRLYKDLAWSGISWDEGPNIGGSFGPYKQSARLAIYRTHVDRLLQEGKAFRCFCSHEDMIAHQQRSLQSDGSFGTYPGRCLSISAQESDDRAAKGEAHTVRFKSSSSPVAVRDLVYGLYKKKQPEDHFIIMKSDGYPTYHFANVVDDHLMEITHVVRGAEWLISTAKHVSLYEAFGWELPRFAHVGLLVDTNRQKLSKRNMDIGIDSYQRDGVLPSALLNFAALLGWNPGNVPNKGVMTLDDMVDKMKTNGMRFTKGDIVVNIEKLHFFQKKHVRLILNGYDADRRNLDEALIKPILREVRQTEAKRLALSKESADGSEEDDDGVHSSLRLLGPPLASLVDADGQRACDAVFEIIKTARTDVASVDDAIEANRFLFWRPSAQHLRASYSQILGGGSSGSGSVDGNDSRASVLVHGKLDTPANAIGFLIRELDLVDEAGWTASDEASVLAKTLDGALAALTAQQAAVGQQGSAPGTAVAIGYKYLRWALMGGVHGPQAASLVEVLGKKETLERLQFAQSVAAGSGDDD